MRDVTKESKVKLEDNSYAKISPLKRALRTKAFPLFVLLIVITALFAILSPIANDGFQAFFRIKTLWRILGDLAVPGLLTIGVGCLIVAGYIDLSAAGVGSLSGVIVAVCVAWLNLPWYIGVIIALAASALIGFLNGFLVNELKQPPFIATMAVSTILSAIMQILSTDKSGQIKAMVSYNDAQFLQIGTFELFGVVSAASVFMVLLFVIYGLALAKSKFGRTLYLMGGNRAATRLAGINPRKITYFLFVNCSVLASLAGIINSSRTKMGGSAALSTMQFTGITAAILGGISFGGGSGGMGGAFLGLLVINTFGTGMTSSGQNPYMTPVLAGALLVAALTFDYFSVRAQNKRVGA